MANNPTTFEEARNRFRKEPTTENANLYSRMAEAGWRNKTISPVAMIEVPMRSSAGWRGISPCDERCSIAAAMLFTAPVFAGPDSRVVDDFIACLIGQSAVALKAGAADATAAQQVAYERCDEPKEVTENPDAAGLYDYVNIMVEKMAAQ